MLILKFFSSLFNLVLGLIALLLVFFAPPIGVPFAIVLFVITNLKKSD